jgi:segregation and condensation protein B
VTTDDVTTDDVTTTLDDDAVLVDEPGSDDTPHQDAAPEALDLSAALEAVLLVTDQPVSSAVLARVLDRPEAEVQSALYSLAAGYAERRSGIDVRCVAGGWRLYTRTQFATYVERFLVDGQQARLTQAALETLAVIAYRQPVTRSRVSAVRGVNVDGVVRTLVTRGLVTEVGNDDTSGAALYATTDLFLERLGLESLDDMPSLAPLLPELAELEDDSTSP